MNAACTESVRNAVKSLGMQNTEFQSELCVVKEAASDECEVSPPIRSIE
jgi:hypothetical protein